MQREDVRLVTRKGSDMNMRLLGVREHEGSIWKGAMRISGQQHLGTLNDEGGWMGVMRMRVRTVYVRSIRLIVRRMHVRNVRQDVRRMLESKLEQM